MKIDKTESLGNGVTRIHATGIGFIDTAAIYADNDFGWDIEVQQTNISDQSVIDDLIEQFRKSEGLARG